MGMVDVSERGGVTMTQENTEKPDKSAAKSPELKARIKYAATLKFSINPTDAELAKALRRERLHHR